MSTQSIHRATRTMPISSRALCDIWVNRVSPVTRRVMARFTTARTSSATTNPDRSASRLLAVSSRVASVALPTGAGFDEVRSTNFQFALRLLLPAWQIGSLRSTLRTSHRLRGFRSLSHVVVCHLQHLPSGKSNVNKTHFLSLSGLSQEQIGTKEKQACCVNSTIRMRTRTK